MAQKSSSTKCTSVDFTWRIEHFFDFLHITRTSEPFFCGPEGIVWYLQVHRKSDNWVFLDVYRLSDVSNETRANLNLKVCKLDQTEVLINDGSEFYTYSNELPCHDFPLFDCPEGMGEFIEYLHDGKHLVLQCKLTVEIPDDDKEFGLLMLHNEKLADVTLCSQEKEFKSHKLVLSARSPVLAAMFEHQMQEKSTNRVEIDDIEPKVLGEMVHWIYTGQSPNLANMALKLLTVADKYELVGLKTMCEVHIGSNLTVERAASHLIFADRHSAKKLKSKVAKFIFAKYKNVHATKGWKNLVKNHPTLMVDVLNSKLNP